MPAKRSSSAMLNGNKHEVKPVLWWLGLCFILAAAFYLRVLNIDFGLPQRLYPDEWSQVEVASRIAQGDLNPHFFRYPAGYMYFLAGFFKAHAAVNGDIALAGLYKLARMASVFWGMATVLLTVFFASFLWNRWTGLIAGALMAVVFAAVEPSHYAIVDVPMTFWVTAALLSLSLAVIRGLKIFLWTAAVLIAAAMATKYTSVLIIPFFWAAIWSVNTEAEDKNLFPGIFFFVIGFLAAFLGILALVYKTPFLNYLTSLTTDGVLETEYLVLYHKIPAVFLAIGTGALCCAAAFFLKGKGVRRVLTPQWFCLSLAVGLLFALSTPYTFIEWRASLQDFFYEYRHMRIGSLAQYRTDSPEYLRMAANRYFSPHGLGEYLADLIKNTGFPVLIVAVFALPGLWKKSKSLFVILIGYFVLYLGIISGWTSWAARYLLPLYPLWTVLAAGGFSDLMKEINNKKIRTAITAGMIVVLFWQPLVYTQIKFKNFLLPDTRELAWDWVLKNVPEGTAICADPFAPDFEMLPKKITVRRFTGQAELLKNHGDCEYYVTANEFFSLAPEKTVKKSVIFDPEVIKSRGKLISFYK